MQITDYTSLEIKSASSTHRNAKLWAWEAIVATLFFIVPALLLFVLSAN